MIQFCCCHVHHVAIKDHLAEHLLTGAFAYNVLVGRLYWRLCNSTPACCLIATAQSKGLSSTSLTHR